MAEDVVEGEIFGVGMLETMAEMYPEHADEATACATMEWFNIGRCEELGHDAEVSVSLKDAEKLGQEGARLARKHSFETLAKLTVAETPAADKMTTARGRPGRSARRWRTTRRPCGRRSGTGAASAAA